MVCIHSSTSEYLSLLFIDCSHRALRVSLPNTILFSVMKSFSFYDSTLHFKHCLWGTSDILFTLYTGALFWEQLWQTALLHLLHWCSFTSIEKSFLQISHAFFFPLISWIFTWKNVFLVSGLYIIINILILYHLLSFDDPNSFYPRMLNIYTVIYLMMNVANSSNYSLVVENVLDDLYGSITTVTSFILLITDYDLKLAFTFNSPTCNDS